jgi:hypothetical protein
MLADPQTITISSVAQSLKAVSRGVDQSAYQTNDGLYRLSAGSQYGKRVRRTVRLDFNKIAADPLLTAANLKYTGSVYLVFDLPLVGYTPAEAKAISDGFIAYLSTSSGAVVTALLGGES